MCKHKLFTQPINCGKFEIFRNEFEVKIVGDRWRYTISGTLMITFHTAFSLSCISYIKFCRFLESFFHFRLSNIKERFGFECRGFSCALVYPLTRAFLLLLSILQIARFIGNEEPLREWHHNARTNLSTKTNCPQIIESQNMKR